MTKSDIKINSCGIQSFSRESAEGRDLVGKLRVPHGYKIARDHARRCICGSMTIIYAYTMTEVIKHCESCKLHEISTSSPGK